MKIEDKGETMEMDTTNIIGLIAWCEQCSALLLDFEIEKYNGLCVDCHEERETDESEED